MFSRTVRFVVFGLLCLVGSGVGSYFANRQSASTPSSVTTVSVDEFNKLIGMHEGLVASINRLQDEFEVLVHSNPRFILARLDQCLDAMTEYWGDKPGCGSFTDWFQPELARALEVGASKKEIAVRLDRVFSMAKEGKYFSSYLRQIDNEGPDALQEYISALKK